ncbi:PepSY domain-containing protein [Salinicoccus hispanicus]|uniref:PepSY domain-containing protein n=1 Tax=Salinicoccus hispanicus TaxID=157225 RepID=A0A6N8U2B5_9STAP|nr:PepSY domain-containing protein [Salinicoccus hispanicus]MXQ50515.1 hypothetical protein [Salinicoccus hispanicus]
MLQKIIRITLLFAVMIVPAYILIRRNRHIQPESIIDALHRQYEGIAFISIDHRIARSKFLGLDRDVYKGRLHMKDRRGTTRYQFTADAYTGEIMETTEL